LLKLFLAGGVSDSHRCGRQDDGGRRAAIQSGPLADLLLAVVILLMTIMATRNLPEILQFVLFRRFGPGIVIAFPQHDIHVRPLEEALPVRTRESDAKPS